MRKRTQYKQRLGYIWRYLFTPFAHVGLYIYGYIHQFIFFPFIYHRAKHNEEYLNLKTQEYVSKLFSIYVYGLKFLGIINFTISDADKQTLRDIRGQLVIANHPSYFDVIILMAHMPQAGSVVKASIFDNFFLKKVMRAAGYIKNSHNSQEVIDACVRRLQQNRNVILFPEGTRTARGNSMHFKRGFVNIALQADAPFCYVHIRVFPMTMQKEASFYAIPHKTAHFTLDVEASRILPELQKDLPRPLILRKHTAQIEQYFQETYMQGLKEDIKNLIISTLNLEDVTATDIEDDMLLFSEEGLGLDSIDALEFGVALQKQYHVKLLNEDDQSNKEAFRSVNTLADFITRYNEQQKDT